MRMRTVLLALLLAFTMACSGSNKLINPPVSGAYEFAVTSNVTGAVTLVEANLAANGNQSSGSGPSQVQILTLQKKIWYVNGVCASATAGQNSLSADVSGNNVALTFNEGGYQFPGQGVLMGASITGNYTVTGSSCPDLMGNTGFPSGYDAGGFVGSPVPALSGTFSGTLTLPNGVENAALTLTENADYSLTVSTQLTGPVYNESLTLTGTAVGNIMFVSGSLDAHPLSLVGYLDRPGAYTGMPNSLLVFDYATLTDTGLLLAQ